jgi:hypothetical protein
VADYLITATERGGKAASAASSFPTKGTNDGNALDCADKMSTAMGKLEKFC